MVKSISKSVEEQEEIQFSYIGQVNSGYGKDNNWLIDVNDFLTAEWIQ